jgi:hypothetical protein
MILLLLSALAAAAQPAPGAPTPPLAAKPSPADPATVAEAMLLIEQEGFEEETIRTADTGLELSLAAMADQIQKKTGEAVPEDFYAQLRQLLRDHTSAALRANMPSIKKQAAEIYAQEFTRDELAHLRELSKDPVMVKAREKYKVLGPKLMALGAYSMKQSEADLDAKIDRLVTDYLAKQSPTGNHS